jgi:hypothetical protein
MKMVAFHYGKRRLNVFSQESGKQRDLGQTEPLPQRLFCVIDAYSIFTKAGKKVPDLIRDHGLAAVLPQITKGVTE